MIRRPVLRPWSRPLTRVVALLLLACAVIAPGALAATSTSGSGAGLTPGDKTVYLLLTNGYRNYNVHVPVGAKADAPVMVVLHPATGTAKYARENYHFGVMADKYKFVVVYPAGTALSWNAGSCCGLGYGLRINDVSFLDSMAKDMVAKNFAGARSKWYATGLSNGASMAYHWACEGETVITGIAPVGGSMQAEGCTNPSRTTKVVQIQGAHDQNYPEDGDPAKRTKHLTVGNSTQSLNKSVSPFLKAHGCDVSNKPKGFADYNLPAPTNSARMDTTEDQITRYWWRGCASGTRYEKIIMANERHDWPCAEQPKRSSIYDTPGVAMSATQTMLNELGLAKIAALGTSIPCTVI